MVKSREVTFKDGQFFLKNNNTVKVTVGPSESMSKSKKNTIDPENTINDFGADAVRLFIMSDSPPEKMCSGLIKVLRPRINLYKNLVTSSKNY